MTSFIILYCSNPPQTHKNNRLQKTFLIFWQTNEANLRTETIFKEKICNNLTLWVTCTNVFSMFINISTLRSIRDGFCRSNLRLKEKKSLVNLCPIWNKSGNLLLAFSANELERFEINNSTLQSVWGYSLSCIKHVSMTKKIKFYINIYSSQNEEPVPWSSRFS